MVAIAEPTYAVLHCPVAGCGLYTGQFVSITQLHVAYDHPDAMIPTPEQIIRAAGKPRKDGNRG